MAAGRGELTHAGAGVASRWYETRICSSRPSYQELSSANGATGAEPLREPSAIPAKTGEPADVVAVVTITVSGLRKRYAEAVHQRPPRRSSGSGSRFRPQLAESDRITVREVHFILEDGPR
jgi:hypothetical protein